MDVACGDCTGCCRSSQFIHITAGEKGVFDRVAENLLSEAPGHPPGHKLMGYDKDGLCPILKQDQCTIYEHRPQTCRDYDCRIFAAAGIMAGGYEKAAINARVEGWRFSYPTKGDREEHRAVTAVVTFMRRHAASFPGGRVPKEPGQEAVVAIKAYKVFLAGDRKGRNQADEQRPAHQIAEAIIGACREFDEKEGDDMTGSVYA